MAEKKLSKKALAKSFRNWYYGHLTCFSQEHMQTFGYLCAMLPLVEELYETKEEQKNALQTYSAFFNTEPQLGTVIVGMTAGLEEAKANGEEIDGEMMDLGRNLSKVILGGKPEKVEEIKKLLALLEEERAVLLTENNYRRDYTDIKFACEKCSDTGITEDGVRCSCVEERIGEAEIWQNSTSSKK